MGGQNGAIVILKVDTDDSAASAGGHSFVVIGGQGTLNLGDQTNEIDVSDKLSGRLGERVAGRAKATVHVDLNFKRDDVGQAFLKMKYRERSLISVMVFDRDNPDTLEGTDIEHASGLITNLSEGHQDQNKSTMALDISLNNDWQAA
jgi:predicted secreted protein